MDERLDAAGAAAWFWSATSLDEQRAPAYWERLEAFEPSADTGLDPLVPPGEHHALPAPPDDDAARWFGSRRSRRRFGPEPLEIGTVNRLLSAVGNGPDGKLVPAAGGVPALQTYLLARNVADPLGGSIWRYDADGHAIGRVGPMPGDDELPEALGVVESLPAAVLVWVAYLPELTAKYGERGLRFALQQGGHAAQNVALRLAFDDLAGYSLGGVWDDWMLHHLGLAHLSPDVIVTTAMALGNPA